MKKPLIGPLFPYYGAKWRSAGYYPEPLFATIREDLCGAAGYSLMWRKKSVLADTSPHIAAAWGFLLKAPIADIAALPGSVASVDEVPAEARALVGFWLNPGSSTPKRTASTRANPNAPFYFAGSVWSERTKSRLVDEIQSVRELGWTFERRDWRDAKEPSELCTYFYDPPYEIAGKHYTSKWTKSDYADLATHCLKLAKAGHQVIVCENAGASWLPFVPLHRYHGSRKDSEEVIWHSHG